MAATITETPATHGTRTRVNLHRTTNPFTPQQRTLVLGCLRQLADPGLTDAGHRQFLSRTAAATLGLHLQHGDEIGRCTICADITTGSLLTESTADGKVRCAACHHRHLEDLADQDTDDEPYEGPDLYWATQYWDHIDGH